MINFNKVLVLAFKLLINRKVIFTGLVLVVIFFVGNRGRTDFSKIKTSQVDSGSLVSEIIASGKITSDSQTTVHSPISGKIIWLGVNKAGYVNAGQILAVLEKERYEVALRQAQQDVIAADAELEKLNEGRRNKTGIESFDEKIARTQIEAKKNKAYDNLKLAERNIKDTQIVSPIAGQVTELNVVLGSEILPTVAIAQISNRINVYFAAEVDEVDINKIKNGQSAKIILDSFEGREFSGNVDSINEKSITTSTGATAFEVRVNFKSREPILIGMNGEANIVINSLEAVLAVPVESIISEKYVWVKKDESFEKIEIQKGFETSEKVEIVSGLNEGEEVVASGFEEITKSSLFQRLTRRFK